MKAILVKALTAAACVTSLLLIVDMYTLLVFADTSTDRELITAALMLKTLILNDLMIKHMLNSPPDTAVIESDNLKIGEKL